MEKFTAQLDGGVNVITVPARADAQSVADLKAMMKSWLLSPTTVHIFDFAKVQDLPAVFVPAAITFKNALKTGGKHLFSTHMSKGLRQYVNQEGLHQVFNPVESLFEAKSRGGLSVNKQGIDVEFINPFIKAVMEALKIQANVEAKPQKPLLKQQNQKYDIGIAGIIGISTSRFSGNVTLCFPAAVFLKIYEIVFDEKHDTITHEIEDFAGELLNIIYGQAKITLNDQMGHSLLRALPTIMAGSDIKVRQVSGSVTVILPFETPIGCFHLEIERLDNPN